MRRSTPIMSTKEVILKQSTGSEQPKRSLSQRVASDLVRRTLYSALQRRDYPRAHAIAVQWQKYEFASLADLEALQFGKLREILVRAHSSVPFYRTLFRSIGFDPTQARLPEDLHKIPILTKSILTSASQNLIAEDIDSKSLMRNASGGSTGKPVEFYQNQDYWESSQASRRMILNWWGIVPGEPMASIWGTDRDISQWTWKESLYQKVCQVRICNAFAMTENRMEQFARGLHEWQPRFVNGYATALELFARFVLDHPEFQIRPVAVESSAETLTDSQRQIIEKAFAAPVYNFYGSREVNNLAAECPAHEGLHTNMLSRFIEVVDEKGNPQPAGHCGRILVTDLSNPVMPFIRYENEDIGSWSAHPCSCGRPFRLLEKVWGRSSDFISTPSGKLIHGEYFTHLFYHHPEVKIFQVLQESIDRVKVSVVLQPDVKNFSLGEIHEKMTLALGQGIHCEVSAVDSIPLPASGKHRFTISRVPPRWQSFADAHPGDSL